MEFKDLVNGYVRRTIGWAIYFLLINSIIKSDRFTKINLVKIKNHSFAMAHGGLSFLLCAYVLFDEYHTNY